MILAPCGCRTGAAKKMAARFAGARPEASFEQGRRFQRGNKRPLVSCPGRLPPAFAKIIDSNY